MSKRPIALGLFLVAIGGVGTAWSDDLKQDFLSEGISQKVRGFTPNRAEMEESSELVKREPEGLRAPKYGKIRLNKTDWAFILDEPEEGEARLFIDTNRDGDLTNDPDTEWKAETVNNLTQYNGSGMLQLPSGDIGRVALYRFDPKDERRKSLKNMLMFYADFGYEYTFALDGIKFTTFLAGTPALKVSLPIDRNGDGKISSRLERIRIGEPFNFTGSTYLFTAEHGLLELKKASESIEQSPLPPDLSIGKKAIPFTVKTMEGNEIEFPKSFAGKIVMLDFWATWCGPCIAEIPNMKAAYQEWHDKGFEILGISLDKENMEEKVLEFLKERELPWPQSYEGKGWDIALAETYDVSGIPFVLLVDGDTGEIIGTSRELRGPKLTEFIGKQLDVKSESAKPAME